MKTQYAIEVRYGTQDIHILNGFLAKGAKVVHSAPVTAASSGNYCRVIFILEGEEGIFVGN